MFIDRYELEPEPPPKRRFRPWAASFAFGLTFVILFVALARAPGTDHLGSAAELTDNVERMVVHIGGLRTWDAPLRIALTGMGAENYGGQVARLRPFSRP